MSFFFISVYFGYIIAFILPCLLIFYKQVRYPSSIDLICDCGSGNEKKNPLPIYIK